MVVTVTRTGNRGLEGQRAQGLGWQTLTLVCESGQRSENTDSNAQREDGGSRLVLCRAIPRKPDSTSITPDTPFIQAVVYEAPGFQGQSWEVSGDVYNLQQPEDSQSPQLTSVGSLRILGGW